MNLKAAPLEPTDLRFPINLATALRLSDARPLIVAAAQARVWIAEAELTQAKVLWFPELNMGFDYIRHDGGGPDFNKGVMTAPSVNFFYGGAGLYGVLATTDAIFAAPGGPAGAERPALGHPVREERCPAAHRRRLLHGAPVSGNLCRRPLHSRAARDVVDRIATLSRDLVPQFEVDRARNMLADISQQAVAARQQWRVQSARLTKVLRLDPRAVVEPLEHDHTQITLIDPARDTR